MSFVKRLSVNADHDSFGTDCNSGPSSDARCGSRGARLLSQSAQNLRFRVIWLLESNLKLCHRDIAEVVGLGAGGVNYYANALIKAVAIKVQNFRDVENKPRYACFFTPEGLADKPALAKHFLTRKLR